MKVAFRLDASVAIGSGHLMRCLALADALHQDGAQIVFIMHCGIVALQAEIQVRGYACRLLPEIAAGFDWQADAAHTLAILKELPRQDCLVVDHYQLDVGWESLLRGAVERLMVIDDLADRKHDCDLLLDQNLHQQPQQRYDALVPRTCRQLLGPRFAMLRPEFLEQRRQLRQRDGQVRRLAVFFGGTDPGAETLKVLAAIAGLPSQSVSFHCDVVVGAANPQRDRVAQLCAQQPHLQFHYQISNMAQVMAATDLCIGAGGTALWERAVLGVPSLVIAIAANQHSATVAMAHSGALLYLGDSAQVTVSQVQQALRFALGNPWLLSSLSQRSLDLVDGDGLARVAAVIREVEPV
jgi:UDP-2,4-diacetamido-2,4,6-trideoxy-beta-L-altropyranose hydrolase